MQRTKYQFWIHARTARKIVTISTRIYIFISTAPFFFLAHSFRTMFFFLLFPMYMKISHNIFKHIYIYVCVVFRRGERSGKRIRESNWLALRTGSRHVNIYAPCVTESAVESCRFWIPSDPYPWFSPKLSRTPLLLFFKLIYANNRFDTNDISKHASQR